jgi:hypothetical protein
MYAYTVYDQHPWKDDQGFTLTDKFARSNEKFASSLAKFSLIAGKRVKQTGMRSSTAHEIPAEQSVTQYQIGAVTKEVCVESEQLIK